MSEEIKRYNHHTDGTIGEERHGGWVLYEDHIAALEFAAKQQAERDVRVLAELDICGINLDWIREVMEGK